MPVRRSEMNPINAANRPPNRVASTIAGSGFMLSSLNVQTAV